MAKGTYENGSHQFFDSHAVEHFFGKFAGTFDLDEETAKDFQFDDAVSFLVTTRVENSTFGTTKDGEIKRTNTFKVYLVKPVSEEFAEKFIGVSLSPDDVSSIVVEHREEGLNDLVESINSERNQDVRSISRSVEELQKDREDRVSDLVDVVKSVEITSEDVLLTDEDEDDDYIWTRDDQDHKKLSSGTRDAILRKFLEVD